MNDNYGVMIRAGAQRNYSRNGVDLFFWLKSPDGHRAFAQRVVFLEQANEGEQVDPLVTLQMETAQELIDCLWDAGLRPRHAQATDETKAAQREHIADLKDIVDRLFAAQVRP